MNLSWKSLMLCAVLAGLGTPVEGVLAQTTSCNTNDSTAPCFAGNTDILNGRKSLLQDDDLVVVGAFGSSNSPQPDGASALTTNSQITSINGTGLSSLGPTSVPVAVAAQLFNKKNKQVISTARNMAGTVFLNPETISVPTMPIVTGSRGLYGVAGDFLGTGYDQVIFLGPALNEGVQQLSFQGLAAVDPNNPAAGLRIGPVSSPVNNASVLYAVAVGVFTDPVPGAKPPAPEIAVLSTDPTGNTTQAVLSFYSVDANLNVSATGKSVAVVDPSAVLGLAAISLASGRFTGGTHDQLVTVYSYELSTVRMATIDFDTLGNPVIKSNIILPNASGPLQPGTNYGPTLNLSTGRFNWYGLADQLAVSFFPGDSTENTGIQSSIQVASFDGNMAPTFGTPYLSTSGCPMGLAVGRFDKYAANPNPPPAQQIDPNPQIVEFMNACTQSAPGANSIAIFNVDPDNNYALTPLPQYSIPTSIFSAAPVPYFDAALPFPFPATVKILAADLQGRSAALGPPTKVTITGHYQPDTVLGVPPMHVDWITPAGGSVPQVFNVSVYPSMFNTAYSFQSGTTGTVSRSGQTSYTAATKVSVNAKVSYGIPMVASASLSASIAAGEVQKNTISKKYNTYSGNKLGFSTHTVFDDVVAATSSQMNVYSYRAIGECVAAAGAPALEGCPAGTQPLYIQFSGPDNIIYISAAEGRNIEWYQPVWEPGNLFSYPANSQQLAADLAGGTTFQALSPTNSVWDVQTASQVTESWTDGGGSNVSSGSQSTQSFDASVSVSAMVAFEGIGASAGISYDYNDSTSISTLNQSGTTFSNSQGIVLNRGIADSSGLYDYQGQSLIYGQLPPTNVIDTGTAPTTEVKANGFIGVAHLVDMVSQGGVNSGNFWPQAYATSPDIALNHPQRWLQKAPSGVNPQQVQFNCPVGYTSSLSSPSCSSSPEAPTPANVADTLFYQMKGLFVTPGGSTTGPQMENTVKGNKVTLRARIYNYSLVNFPAGSYAHVQFYAQPWNPELGEFASVPGNPSQFAPAVFIGEDDIVPPPAFCGGVTGSGDPCIGSQVLNWEFAQATWDTSLTNVPPDTTWKFWVLVWVENNGKLVSELPGHGLISIPAAPYNSIGDAPIEPYSNNVGYYNQVFTVFGSTGLGKPSGNKKLTVEPVNLLGAGTLLRDHPIAIRAKHTASGGDINSLMTLYYDGDPKHGGTLFDTQMISRVELGKSFVDNVSYSPKTCGTHEIYVRSIPLDGSAKGVTAKSSAEVTIDPVESVDEMIRYVQGLPRDKSTNDILWHLNNARRDFAAGNIKAGRGWIQCLLDYLEHNHNCDQLPVKAKKALVEQSEDLLQCVP